MEAATETLMTFKEIDCSMDADDSTLTKNREEKQSPSNEEPSSKVNSTSVPEADPSSEAALEIDDVDADIFIVAEDEEEEETLDVKPTVSELVNKTPEPENKKLSSVWVTNVSPHTKASNLKKFISDHGKVSSVKILSKLNSYFGLVIMKSAEDAANCIKKLDGTLFEGKKIKLSNRQPDIRPKPSTSEKGKSKSQEADKSKEKRTKDGGEHKKEKNSKIKQLEDTVSRLRKDLEHSKNEVQRLRRRLDIADERLKTANSEIGKLNFQLRSERRKFNSDLEHAENRNKLKEIRLDADRAILSKELDEVKRLRDHLKSKIESVKSPKRDYHQLSRKSSDNSLKRKWRESSPHTSSQRNHRTPPPPKIFNNRKRSSDSEDLFYKSPRRESSHNRSDRRTMNNLTAPVFVGSLVKAVGGNDNRSPWNGSSDNGGRKIASQVTIWNRDGASSRRNMWN